MRDKSLFSKKATAFLTSFGFVVAVVGVSVALAAVTISNTGITGDSAFTGLTGVASATIDLGAGTLSLQTASNSPITAGTGLFAIGGALNVTGTVTVAANGSSLKSFSFTTATSTGAVNFGGSENVTGTITVSSNAFLGGTLNVTSTLNVSGSSTFRGPITVTSTAPDTVSNCGTSPTSTGVFGVGRIVTGNDASSTCTVTFGTPFAYKPVCVVTSEATTTTSTVYAVTSRDELTHYFHGFLHLVQIEHDRLYLHRQLDG